MIRFTWSRRLLVAVGLIAGTAAYFGVPEQQLTGADRLPIDFDADPEARAKHDALQQRGAAVATRIAYKEQLVTGLLERRYHLDEVAREFLQVISEDEASLSVLRLSYRAPTDEARAALNVIDYARSQPVPACEQSAAVAHLQAEYRRLYPSE